MMIRPAVGPVRDVDDCDDCDGCDDDDGDDDSDGSDVDVDARLNVTRGVGGGSGFRWAVVEYGVYRDGQVLGGRSERGSRVRADDRRRRRRRRRLRG